MKKCKFLFYSLALIQFFTASLQASAAVEQEQTFSSVAEDALIWAKAHLSQEGVLEENKMGFVYLKVDDGYIKDLYGQFAEFGFEKPPASEGAHVSVMYPFEEKKIGTIKELGRVYSFTLKGIRIVTLKHRKFVILDIDAPGLEQLRKEYGLRPLLLGHPFHISIAKHQDNDIVSFASDLINYKLVANY